MATWLKILAVLSAGWLLAGRRGDQAEMLLAFLWGATLFALVRAFPSTINALLAILLALPCLLVPGVHIGWLTAAMFGVAVLIQAFVRQRPVPLPPIDEGLDETPDLPALPAPRYHVTAEAGSTVIVGETVIVHEAPTSPPPPPSQGLTRGGTSTVARPGA